MRFSSQTEHRLAELAQWIEEASTVVWFTGAGISTESGLPDYRGPNGAWTCKEQGRPLPRPSRPLSEIRPNAAHHAIVRLERMGKCAFLISQNVDDLHLESGYPIEKLAELHGNRRRLRCRRCDLTFSIVDLAAMPKRRRTRRSPAASYECPECGGPLVRSVVNFGDKLPAGALEASFEWAERSDVFVVVGSSCFVTPASDIPLRAHRTGSLVAVLNIGETGVEHDCDLRIDNARAGELLPALVDRLSEAGATPG